MIPSKVWFDSFLNHEAFVKCTGGMASLKAFQDNQSRALIFPVSSGLTPSPDAGCNKAFVAFRGCKLRLLALPSVHRY